MDSRLSNLDQNQLVKDIQDIGAGIEQIKGRQYVGGQSIKTQLIPATKLVKLNYGGGNTILSTDVRDYPANAPYNFKHTLAALGPSSSNGTYFSLRFTPDNQTYPAVVPGAYVYIDTPTNPWTLAEFSRTGFYSGLYVQQSYPFAWQPSSGVKPAGQTWTLKENAPVFKNWSYLAQRWTSAQAITIYVYAFVVSSDTGVLELITQDDAFSFNDA